MSSRTESVVVTVLDPETLARRLTTVFEILYKGLSRARKRPVFGSESMSGHARVKLVCYLVHAERVLLIQFEPTVEDGRGFLMPPGGGLEFRETLEHGVRREVREEVGIEIRDLRYLGFSENIFTHRGRDLHELVFQYAGAPPSGTIEALATVPVDDNGTSFTARWYSLADLAIESRPVFPVDARDRLEALLAPGS